MSKQNTTDSAQHFFEQWVKQTQIFFETSEKNLQDIFEAQNTNQMYDGYTEKMCAWIQMLKNQCQALGFEHQIKAFKTYSSLLVQIYYESSERLFALWKEKNHGARPIKNSQELYALWLDCCHEVYLKAMKSKRYQSAYGEFLNASLQWWKSTLHRNNSC